MYLCSVSNIGVDDIKLSSMCCVHNNDLIIFQEERVITRNLRFEIVCNSHFYNYSMHRSVVVATIKLGVMSLP